jgi:hypothetical protein
MSDVFEKGLLKQFAVYWGPLGQDPQTGNMVYDEPVEIQCRWVDTNQLYIKANGDESASKCMVMVDRDLEIGGALWQGRLENLVDHDEPSKNKGANIIQGWNKVPDEVAKKFVRTAIC